MKIEIELKKAQALQILEKAVLGMFGHTPNLRIVEADFDRYSDTVKVTMTDQPAAADEADEKAA